jgi:hypothetical protein
MQQDEGSFGNTGCNNSRLQMTANHGFFRNHDDDEPELEKLDFAETNDVNQTFHSEGAEPKSLRISH